MEKNILTVCCLLIIQFASAQHLLINGDMTTSKDNTEGAKIIIAKNGINIEEQNVNKKGHFNLKLALGSDYKITFTKAGYVDKIVSINTEVPEEIIETNPHFPPIKLIINLLPYMEGIDLSVFEQPIAILSYHSELDDFIFDKEYAEKIRERIAQTEKELNQSAAKQKDTAYKHSLAQEETNKQKQIKEENLELDSQQQQAEQEKNKKLREKYDLLIAQADSAFQLENYALAKLRYVDAEHLQLNEEYPQKQIQKINKIIHSFQYQEKLAEYQKAKTLAEKSMQQKNYAGAKVYYQKALSILSIDQEAIEHKIIEIDHLIEAIQLAEIEKAYQENIGKADKAYQEKAYAVARFYYTKALEIKINDKYAAERLKEVGNLIGKRQSKEVNL